MESSKKTTSFSVPNSDMQLKKDIIEIASSKNLKYSRFLRIELMKIRDSYPAEMKKPVDKT